MTNPVAEAYARLNSLKTNLPEGYEVQEKYVTEFHAILDMLESATGYDLANFRVPSSEVRPKVVAVRRAGYRQSAAAVHHSRDNWCERRFLLMKIDGVLNYFTYQAPQEPPRIIGFKPPAE
ncbi:MAG TPA: hypothetical protein VIN93_04765 [Bryobacteraceae bacterium]|jgi:hypothetical protein